MIRLLLLLLLTAQPVAAATYFVAPDGSNGNSGLTKTDAWRTIDHAEEQVQGGDTVIVADGVYSTGSSEWSEVIVWVEANGNGEMITFKAENRHGAIIDGNNSKYGGIWVDGRAGYVRFDGFVIRNFNIAGVNTKDSDDQAPYKRAKQIEMVNLLIHNVGRSGITYQEVDGGKIENCEIHTLTTPHSSHNQYHGIYISDNTDSLSIQGNKVWGIPYGWPIHVYDGHGRGRATNHTIANNHLVNNNTQRDGGLVLYGSGHTVRGNVVDNQVDAPGYKAMIYNNTLTSTTLIEGNRTNLTTLCERFSGTTDCSGATVRNNVLNGVVTAPPPVEPPPVEPPVVEPPMFTECEIVMVCREKR